MRKFLHGKRHFHANTDNRNRARAARLTRKMEWLERMIWAAVPVIHEFGGYLPAERKVKRCH